MIFRAIPLILFLCIGCRTASTIAKKKAIAENHKDVVVLSNLIRDYILKTRRLRFTLADIAKNDTLGQITKNFSGIELANWPNVWQGGYVVYFKYSGQRNKDSVKLIQSEKIPWKLKEKNKIGRTDEQLSRKYDGEIHISYPERFYHIVGITVKKPNR